VQHAAGKAIIVLAAMQPLNAVTFIGDGIFQGAKDFQYLAGGMAVACTLASCAMLAGRGRLQDVWLALLGLQLVRAVTIALRYWDVVPVLGGSPLALDAQKR
jgi:Na+-driven multidrug efflux pump